MSIEVQREVKEESFVNTNLSLRQQVNMLRRLRQLACKNVIDLFVDAEPFENHSLRDEMVGVTILNKA